MKTEINLENKAKFFAQYWGQYVMRDYTTTRIFPVDESNIKFEIEDAWLELKSLSDISDEDAIEVAKMLGCNDGNSKGFMIGYGRDYVKRERNMKSNIVDFLRSRDYLVPWMGLSCEELIETSWAKLK